MKSKAKLNNCVTCGKAFKHMRSLKIHEVIHTGEKPYICEICRKAFNNQGSLRNHQRIHNEENPYVCKICRKGFKRSVDLKVHARFHTGERPYVCITCSKAFTTLTHLRNHTRIHTGEKPYVCETCRKPFNRFFNLKIHQRIHSGVKPFSCKICKKAFRHSNSAKIHKRIYNRYVCETCKRGFSLLGDLKHHERNHNGEKRYDYKLRNRPFVQLHRLQDREKIHVEEKPNVSKAFESISEVKWYEGIHAGNAPHQSKISKKSISKAGVEQKSVSLISFGMLSDEQPESVPFAVKPFGCGVCDVMFAENNLKKFLEHCVVHKI